MRERMEVFARIVCLILAACVILEIAKGFSARDPLKSVRIPAVPHLAATTATNSTSAQPGSGAPGHGMPMPPPMMGMRMGGMPGGGGPPLPPEIKARLDRVVDKELLGPVIRPLPMALLGIAGETAFLRAPNGQTGLAKAGDSVGNLKLLVIGTNRVLVEEAGKKQELTIFSGYGGESLMPAAKENNK